MNIGWLVLAFMVRQAPSANTSPSTAPGSDSALAARLRAAGLAVERAGTTKQPFFSVPARVLRVSGDDVQVYRYRSARAAADQARLVSPDGSTVGTASPSWMAPPHFFRRDSLIALYLGSNPATIDALSRILGPPFAGR